MIVNVGGPDAGVVAFDRGSGRVAWTATDEAASYSAPTVAEFAGKPLLLMVTRLQFLGLDPESGSERFRIPFGMRGPTVNGATPVVLDGNIFLTASYGIGADTGAVERRSSEAVVEQDRSHVEPIRDARPPGDNFVWC